MNQLGKIKHLEINGLFDKKNIQWEFGDVNILVGKNGSGKSTILNILRSLLRVDVSDSLDLCSRAKVTLDNSSFVEHESLPVSIDELKKTINRLVHNFHSDNSQHNLKKNKYTFDYKAKPKNKNKLKNELHDKMMELSLSLDKLNVNSEAGNIGFSKGRFNFGSTSEKKLKDEFNVEFISTINMSANSLNEIKSSEGVKTTILDMEMLKELSRFKLLFDSKEEKYNLIKDKFLQILNDMFSDSGKTVRYNEGKLLFSRADDRKILTLSHLSSGERQLIYILLKVINSMDKPAVLLMDEPEISLHLSWQEKLIESIKSINSECQIIIVTHSPAMVMNGWMASYIDIDNISEGI